MKNPKSEEIVKTLVSGQVIAYRPKSRTQGLQGSSHRKKREVNKKVNEDLVLTGEEKIISDIDRVKRSVIHG